VSNEFHSAHTDLRLFEKFIAEKCNDSDLAEIDQLLRESAAARITLLDYCQLHIDLAVACRGKSLGQEFCADLKDAFPSESVTPSSVSQVRNVFEEASKALAKHRFSASLGKRVPLLTSYLAVSACALMVFLLGVLFQRHFSSVWSHRVAQSTSNQVIARLVSDSGSVFNASTGRVLEYGAKINTQETLSLLEGVAQVQFDNGPTLNIEGPAVLTVTSQGVPVLCYGTLFVRLPWAHRPFVIETSMGSVHLDEDDAAGIVVLGSDIQVHGFHGEVVFVPSELNETSQIVRRGEAKRFYRGPSGEMRSLRQRFSPKSFPSRLSLSSDQLTISSAYVESVRKSSPIGYWRFEEEIDGRVLNEFPGGVDCILGGAATIVPQLDNNHVIEFGLGPKRGYLIGEKEIDDLFHKDYAIEAWVKPSHIHEGTIIALSRCRSSVREEERHAFLLQTRGNERRGGIPSCCFRFLHRFPPGARTAQGTSCCSSSEYKIRRWQHVVAEKDSTHMRLYIDGKLARVEKNDTAMAGNLTLVIGQSFSFDSVFPFIGQLDELAIYNHWLSPQEIKYRSSLPRRARDAEGS